MPKSIQNPENGADGYSILLIDDDLTNQVVVQGIFHELGYASTVVNNDTMALQIMEREAFDIIFLDCPMPVHDGIETVRRIRLLEEGKKNRAIIIAMTSKEIVDSRERCYAAGIDDIISKPIGIVEIHSILEKWRGTLGSNPQSAKAGEAINTTGENPFTEGSNEAVFFDREDVLKRFDDNVSTMCIVISAFLGDLEHYLAEIEENILNDKGSLEDLQRAYHTIKGAATNIGAIKLGKIAYELEQLAKEKEIETCKERFTELRSLSTITRKILENELRGQGENINS